MSTRRPGSVRLLRARAVFLLLLAACTETASPSTDATVATTVTFQPAPAPAGTPLAVALAGMPRPGSSLSDLARTGRPVWSMVLDGLTALGSDGSPVPALATGWDTLDSTTWRFELRPGVVFQDGVPLDPQTATAALRVALEQAASAPEPPAGVASRVLEVRPAAGAVEVVTDGPEPLLPALLASIYLLAPSSLQDLEDADRAPLGTGPYQVAEWRGERVRLVRWGGSWRAGGPFDPVTFTSVADAPARAEALSAGKVDLALDLAVADIPALEAAGVSVEPTHHGQVLSVVYTGRGPTESPQVRRALNLAVDKVAISYALRGDIDPPGVWAPQGVVGYDPERPPWDYNPDRAIELLERAGYPNGFPLAIEVVEGRSPSDDLIYESLAGYLELVGVDLDIQELSTPAWRARLAGRTPWGGGGFSLLWSAGPLADAAVPYSLVGCGAPTPVVCDQTTRRQLRTVRNSVDTAERSAALTQLLDSAADAPAAIWLTEPLEVWGSVRGVNGITVHHGEIHLDSASAGS